MQLNATNVRAILMDCLFKTEELPLDGSAPENTTAADGVTQRFEFHPERLESHREEVKSMLKELPQEFHENSGGGMSFLRMPLDSNGNQWGEQINAQELLVLGIGLNLIEYCLPRPFWAALPGGVPYLMVKAPA